MELVIKTLGTRLGVGSSNGKKNANQVDQLQGNDSQEYIQDWKGKKDNPRSKPRKVLAIKEEHAGTYGGLELRFFLHVFEKQSSNCI